MKHIVKPMLKDILLYATVEVVAKIHIYEQRNTFPDTS